MISYSMVDHARIIGGYYGHRVLRPGLLTAEQSFERFHVTIQSTEYIFTEREEKNVVISQSLNSLQCLQ